MSTNSDAAESFREIADLLDVLGEKFKPEAYRRAVRSIEGLTEDLRAVAARDQLRSIPGVGDAIEEKIREFLETGHIDYLERLRREIPPGLREIIRLPGLGPKTARRFWTELGVEGPAELAAAIAAGKLDGVKGFGPKKIEQIRAALASAAAGGGASSVRLPIDVAYPIAHRLLAGLRTLGAVEKLEVAGSFRRCRETVGDLDILVTSGEPERVFDAFTKLPDVAEVRLRGPTKETVLLHTGLQVDLRVVEPAAFGAALLYFTGSKDHNVRLRSLARDRGLKINEYGTYRGDERIAGATEEEMYASLQLAWVPPEIREDHGEVDAAAKNALPTLVTGADLTGDLHVHLPEKATSADLDRIVSEARHARLGFLAIVVGGVGEDGETFSLPDSLVEQVSRLSERGLVVGRAIELPASSKAKSTELPPHEVRLVRPTRAEPDPPSGGPTGPVVVHVGGEEPSRKWVAWAGPLHGSIEVGPGPDRVDSIGARTAIGAGVQLHLPTAVGRSAEDPVAPIGLGFARRAGAEKRSVLNAASAATVTTSWTAARPGRTRSGS
jgi:DNA polymerase/3'-5' exonuclease PolX